MFFGGGKRSGKTDLVVEYQVSRAFQYPNSGQLIARKARNAAKESIWNGTLNKYLNKFIHPSLYQKDESELRVTFQNGSYILVGGLDDKDRTEKTFGNEYITVYLNEATQVTWKTCQLAMTLAAQTCHDDEGYQAVPKTILDCNPRGPRHWVRKVCIEHIDPNSGDSIEDPESWGVISDWTPYDNIENLSPEYIKTLESLPPVMRARMLKGQWMDNEGLVYDEFNEDAHICKRCPTEPAECPRHKTARRVVCGCDFGYTAPFCWLWGAIDRDGRLLIFKEHYEREVIVEDHAEIIKNAGIKYAFAVADHDSEDAATLRRHGVMTVQATKTKPISASIDLMKARLVVLYDDRPRLEVCQYCKNTIDEFYNYLWDDKKDDVAIDDMNHALDPLRYIVTELDGLGGTGMGAVRLA